MRGKRSKAYRKLMNSYALTFGFREPYQVLVDSAMVVDTDKCKMELVPALKRTLQGDVKPMITQCSIRHLYNHDPKLPPAVIDHAKTFERRRCNHHTLENPLPETECLESVLVHNGQNKHRYVVAAQDPQVRQMFRAIPGVPMIYVKRSVMIMEPMAEASIEVKEETENGKFRVGLKDKKGVKRKRGEEEEGMEGEDGEGRGEVKDDLEKKKKRKRGPKGPNPLSVKRKKTSKPQPGDSKASDEGGNADGQAKKKRKRKHKSKGVEGSGNQDTVLNDNSESE